MSDPIAESPLPTLPEALDRELRYGTPALGNSTNAAAVVVVVVDRIGRRRKAGSCPPAGRIEWRTAGTVRSRIPPAGSPTLKGSRWDGLG